MLSWFTDKHNVLVLTEGNVSVLNSTNVLGAIHLFTVDRELNECPLPIIGSPSLGFNLKLPRPNLCGA